jgi:hypothetical protein
MAMDGWQISGDHRAGYLDRSHLTDTQTVKPWGVDAVSGATPKASQRAWVGETRLTAAYVEASASRVVGLRWLGAQGLETPYTRLRLSHLILAWHGAAGSLEAGTVLVPVSWASGLLVNRLAFSGGHARVDWGNSGVTEGFWTDTLEDAARFRYYDMSIAGVRHAAPFAHGEVGLALLDTSRSLRSVFPKVRCARGTFTSLDIRGQTHASLRWFAEMAYGQLQNANRTDTRGVVAGSELSLAPGAGLRVLGGYLGPDFNPAAGYYNVDGSETGFGSLEFPLFFTEAGLKIKPVLGWKQQRAGNFLAPGGEVSCFWPQIGVTVKVYETTEQPAGRWGAEDHREYTGVTASWEAPLPFTVTGRWEKIYDGFRHVKDQQWSGEIRVRY